jgi:hypothetical protein
MISKTVIFEMIAVDLAVASMVAGIATRLARWLTS